MRFPFFIICSFLLLPIMVWGQSTIDLINLSDSLFALRAEAAEGERVSPQLLDKINGNYIQAMQVPGFEKQVGAKLLLSMYFQGCFAYKDDADRLQIFAKATKLGSYLFSKYPNDPVIAYGYMANLSLWAKERGIFGAIRAGFADKLKNVGEKVLALNSTKQDSLMAGVYQILGRSHHLLPRIPFVLSWPNRNSAEMYLQKAVQLDPNNPNNLLFLAEFYRDQGQWEKSMELVITIQSREVRKDFALEDRRIQWKAKDLNLALKPFIQPERLAALKQKVVY